MRRQRREAQATIAQLAEQHDINAKMVMKWRGRTSVEDMPMSPKEPRSTVLSPGEEAFVRCLSQAHAFAA